MTLLLSLSVLGLLLLKLRKTKALKNRAYLPITVGNAHITLVDREDRLNPCKSPLATAIDDALKAEGINPLYIVAGSSEVRVGLADCTLVYRTSSTAAQFLKALQQSRPATAFSTALKLIEIRRDGISPLRKLLNPLFS